MHTEKRWYTGPGYTVKAGYNMKGVGFFGQFDQIMIDYPSGRSRTAESFEAGVFAMITQLSPRYIPYLEVTAGVLATGVEASNQEIGADLLGSFAAGFLWMPTKWAGLFAEARFGNALQEQDEDESDEEFEERQKGRMESYRFSAGLRLQF